MADLSAAGRRRAAGRGTAMADGSFPISTRDDLANAIHAYGRANNNRKAAVKSHIKRRAAAIGATGMLPDHWT